MWSDRCIVKRTERDLIRIILFNIIDRHVWEHLKKHISFIRYIQSKHGICVVKTGPKMSQPSTATEIRYFGGSLISVHYLNPTSQ